TTSGEPIYTDKIDGHFIWDLDPDMCDPGCDCWMQEDEDYTIKPKKKKKKERYAISSFTKKI
ncbi:polyprotein-like, partial [Trifolium medium]|nr:polyprotein-like [Trifolium medium]